MFDEEERRREGVDREVEEDGGVLRGQVEKATSL